MTEELQNQDSKDFNRFEWTLNQDKPESFSEADKQACEGMMG